MAFPYGSLRTDAEKEELTTAFRGCRCVHKHHSCWLAFLNAGLTIVITDERIGDTATHCSLRAFIRLEVSNQINYITIYNAKWEIVKAAIADYLAHPKYAL